MSGCFISFVPDILKIINPKKIRIQHTILVQLHKTFLCKLSLFWSCLLLILSAIKNSAWMFDELSDITKPITSIVMTDLTHPTYLFENCFSVTDIKSQKDLPDIKNSPLSSCNISVWHYWIQPTVTIIYYNLFNVWKHYQYMQSKVSY